MDERARERFWLKVDRFGADGEENSGCWEWKGNRDSGGYGRWAPGFRQKQLKTHRVAFELSIGTIPEGLVLDHLCLNRLCARPDHLEPVSIGENVLRGSTIAAAHRDATACPAGHPYAGENLFFDGGHRKCRTCVNERNRAARRRRQLLNARKDG